MSGYGSEKKGGFFKKLVITLLLLFSILIISYVAYKLFFIPDPSVEGIEAFEMISVEGEITFEAKNLRSLIVSIRQGDRKSSPEGS